MGTFPHSKISISGYCFFKSIAFSFVLLVKKIFVLNFPKAQIIEDVTPPAPNIKIFLGARLFLKKISSKVKPKPGSSVLYPIILFSFFIRVLTDLVFFAVGSSSSRWGIIDLLGN